MTMVKTRTFCCCLPTRLGVVITALIGLLAGGALSVAGGLNAHRVEGSKVSIAISIVVYSILAIVSFLGLVGAIGRKLTLVKLYFAMLLAHLTFSLGVGIFALYRIYHDKGAFVKDCIATSTAAESGDPKKLCNESLRIIKGLMTTLFILVWLFEIWGCVIVSSYAGQLADENAVEGVVKDTEAW